jgi:hypothetical protein
MDLFEEFKVIDVDTHVTEPADTWTSRVPENWKDRVPHIERLERIFRASGLRVLLVRT